MFKSSVPELCWPAVIDPQAATVFHFLHFLRRTQWLKPTVLQKAQSIQLAARLEHARQHSAVYSGLLGGSPIAPQRAFSVLATLPILRRSDLQSGGTRYFENVPPEHGKVSANSTSGSTGEPVTVRCSGISYALRAAHTMRGHAWHGVSFLSSLGAIRGGVAEHGQGQSMALPHWGGYTAKLFETGPSAALDITTPLDEQVLWLKQVQPAVFMTLPSNLDALLDLMPAPWPGLATVLTLSEALHPDIRARVKQQWGARVFDKYSSEELGPIAFECAHGQYHVVENLVTEVLNDNDEPCKVGEIGRVVVTDMYNFATGLFRYEIRDHAMVGEACACGRGLMPLRRIMGRVRNIMTVPDGRRFWPLFGMRTYGELAPIRQLQVVQTALDSLTLRMVVHRALTPEEESAVADRVRASVGWPMRISFETVEGSLITGNNRKFEEFKSLIVPPEVAV